MTSKLPKFRTTSYPLNIALCMAQTQLINWISPLEFYTIIPRKKIKCKSMRFFFLKLALKQWPGSLGSPGSHWLCLRASKATHGCMVVWRDSCSARNKFKLLTSELFLQSLEILLIILFFKMWGSELRSSHKQEKYSTEEMPCTHPEIFLNVITFLTLKVIYN